MCDVISGDSRQRIGAKFLIIGFAGIFDSNIERKHEYSSGDSRQRIAVNGLIDGFNGIFMAKMKESINIRLEIPDK